MKQQTSRSHSASSALDLFHCAAGRSLAAFNEPSLAPFIGQPSGALTSRPPPACCLPPSFPRAFPRSPRIPLARCERSSADRREPQLLHRPPLPRDRGESVVAYERRRRRSDGRTVGRETEQDGVGKNNSGEHVAGERTDGRVEFGSGGQAAESFSPFLPPPTCAFIRAASRESWLLFLGFRSRSRFRLCSARELHLCKKAAD